MEHDGTHDYSNYIWLGYLETSYFWLGDVAVFLFLRMLI